MKCTLAQFIKTFEKVRKRIKTWPKWQHNLLVKNQNETKIKR